MKLNDWLTLIAIVVGPIGAVLITLWIEGWRRSRERKFHIIRMLLTTRHMPADVQWNAAVNLIPAEFHDRSDVMDAWRSYHREVNHRVEDETALATQRRYDAATSNMIFRVLQSVKLTNLSESDIQTQAYLSTGFVTRDSIYVDSLRALPRIAEILERQRELNETMTNFITGRAVQAQARSNPSIDQEKQ